MTPHEAALALMTACDAGDVPLVAHGTRPVDIHAAFPAETRGQTYAARFAITASDGYVFNVEVSEAR